VCLIPVCGVFWADEIPDFPAFRRLPESARLEVLRLYAIRYALWKNEPLTAEDQQFWDEALKQVPHYALFQRLQVAQDVLDLQEQIQQSYDSAFEELTSNAKEIVVTQKVPGVESFAVTLEVPPKAPRKTPWWKRLRGNSS
jgi:hypothetical protein